MTLVRHLAVLALTVPLAACGGGRTKGTTLARVSLLPRSTTFVAGLDFTKLKQSPFWSAARFVPRLMYGRQSWIDVLAEKCNLDLERDLRWGLVALNDGSTPRLAQLDPLPPPVPPPVLVTTSGASPADPDEPTSDPQAVLILNGAWNRAQAERCAEAIERKPTKNHETRDPRITEYDNDYYVAWLGPDTIAIAREHEALPFLREIVDHKSSVLDNPVVARMLGQVDRGATLWAAGAMTRRNPLRSPLEDADIDDHDSHVTALSVSAVLGTELTATGVAEFASPTEATAAVPRFEKSLHWMVRDFPLVDGTKATSDGNRFVVRGHLDRAALDRLTSTVTAYASNQTSKKTAEMPTAPPAVDPTPPPPPPGPDPAEVERLRKQDEAAAAAKAKAAEDQAAKDKADNVRKANAHSTTGLAFLEAKIYDKALEEFTAAYALVPLPQLLYNIAASYDGLKDRKNALDAYKRYVDAEPNGARAKVSAKRIVVLTTELKK